MANKQLLQSAGDGTAVPAGYVGQIVRCFKSNTVTIDIPATTWTNLKDESSATAVLSLTPGIWLITGLMTGGGNISIGNDGKQWAISEFSGTTTTDHVVGTNVMYMSSPTTTQDSQGSLTFTVNNSTAKTYYIKLYLSVAASTAVLRFNVNAIRIA